MVTLPRGKHWFLSVLAGVPLVSVSAAQRALPARAQQPYELFVIRSATILSSQATGMTGDGRVVGRFDQGAGDRPFLWSRATGALDLGTPLGFTRGQAADVNRFGLVVGTCFDGSTSVATLWTGPGHVLVLPGLPGGTSSRAVGVSDDGSVVGYTHVNDLTASWIWDAKRGLRALPVPGLYTPRDVDVHERIVGGNGFNPYSEAWILDGATGKPTVLGTFGGPVSEANARNPAGQVVGGAMTVLYEGVPFVWTAETGLQGIGSLAPPGELWGGTAFDINVAGAIVGSSAVARYDGHAFVRHPGEPMRDLNDLVNVPSGLVLRQATRIDNRGRICGVAQMSGGASYGFVLHPVAQRTP
jgi:probable HAF family extracellular repeat protein